MSTIRDRAAAIRQRYPRASRWALRVFAALAALYVLFVVVVNAVLASHVIERSINESTHDVEMHWGRAFMLWPGRVHVNDFVLRVDDANVQALLTIEHADTWLELLPLVHKRVVLHRPSAEGCRYWMRHRVAAITDENRAEVAAYPPIPGAEPPLFDPVRSAAPAPPSDQLWHIVITEGEAVGDEIWIQELRYRGAFHGHGGFDFWPLVAFSLYPTRGTLLPGQLELGEHTVSSDFALDLQLQLIAFEVPKVLGIEPLRGLTAHAAVSAHMPNGEFLRLYRGRDFPKVDFERAELRAELEFRDRHFTESSDLLATFRVLRVSTELGRAEGPLQVVAKGKPEGHLELGADSSGLALHVAKPRMDLRLERSSVRADVRAELDASLSVGAASARGELVMPALDWIDHLTANAWRARGSARAELQANRDAQGIVTGSMQATFAESRVEHEGLGAAFVGSSRATVRGGQTLVFSQLSLDLPVLTLREGATMRSSSLRATFHGATLAVDPFKLQAPAEIEVGDSGLLAVPLEARGGLAAFASKWLRGGPANLRGKMALEPSRYAVDVDRGRIGLVEIHGFLQKVGAGPFGAFALSTSGVSAGVGINAGGATLHPLVGESWVHEQRAKTR